ncbi:MAG: hypothetical protein O6951_01105, partial [Actinobacteria bacterium]|nr:hypothetical protein [Actinomycetota bacterium]
GIGGSTIENEDRDEENKGKANGEEARETHVGGMRVTNGRVDRKWDASFAIGGGWECRGG